MGRYRAWKGLTDEAEQIVLQDYFEDSSGKHCYYQVNAVNAAIEAIAKGRDRILLVMATGTGKSVSRADSANCPLPRPSGRRNLFLTRFSRLREFQVRNGLRELGYIEGQNSAIYYRSVDGHSEHFPTLATELVRLEMSHKGGADAQVAERAGNDLERWRLLQKSEYRYRVTTPLPFSSCQAAMPAALCTALP